jgi:hypothetical protein
LFYVNLFLVKICHFIIMRQSLSEKLHLTHIRAKGYWQNFSAAVSGQCHQSLDSAQQFCEAGRYSPPIKNCTDSVTNITRHLMLGMLMYPVAIGGLVKGICKGTRQAIERNRESKRLRKEPRYWNYDGS